MLLVHVAHMVNARVADAHQVGNVFAHHLMHAPLPPRTDRALVATRLAAFLTNRVAALAADPKLPAPPSRAGSSHPPSKKSSLTIFQSRVDPPRDADTRPERDRARVPSSSSRPSPVAALTSTV
jgi:hypothetical protein